MPWTGFDVIAASAFAVALFGALLLGAVLTRARPEILASPLGWRLVASSLALFALRGLLHFVSPGTVPWLQHLAGILAATLLPIGLYLVLHHSYQKEVDLDGGG